MILHRAPDIEHIHAGDYVQWRLDSVIVACPKCGKESTVAPDAKFFVCAYVGCEHAGPITMEGMA